MEVVVYEILTSTTTLSAADLQSSVGRHGAAAGVEHSYWARCQTGWRGLLFLADAPGLPGRRPARDETEGEGSVDAERCARAIEAAVLALSPQSVMTVVRADLPR